MDMTTRAGSPLRQRMVEDMRMRKLEPRTQEAYIGAVRKLTVFLKHSPDAATVEDLRNFQLHLVDTGRGDGICLAIIQPGRRPGTLRTLVRRLPVMAPC